MVACVIYKICLFLKALIVINFCKSWFKFRETSTHWFLNFCESFNVFQRKKFVSMCFNLREGLLSLIHIWTLIKHRNRRSLWFRNRQNWEISTDQRWKTFCVGAVCFAKRRIYIFLKSYQQHFSSLIATFRVRIVARHV